MNKKDYIRQKNQWLQHLDFQSRRHQNCVRFGRNETKEHIRKKLETILDNSEAESFFTEIIDSSRKFRADILLFFKLSSCYAQVVEIAINETAESLDKKRNFWTGKKGFDFKVIR